MAANGSNHTVYVSDGTFDSSGGVDSIPVTTIQSALTPNGLPRNKLAWLVNGTIRDGGITPRAGWKRITRMGTSELLYQGGYLYRPKVGNPYFVMSVSGNIMKLDPDDLANSGNLSIDASVLTVPTAAPWTIELAFHGITFQNQTLAVTPGQLVGPTTPEYTGVLGYNFVPFIVPPIHPPGPILPGDPENVIVTLNAGPWSGGLDFLNLFGQDGFVTQTVFSGSPWVSGTTHSQVQVSVSRRAFFRVVSFTPPYQKISVQQHGNPQLERKAFFTQAEEFLIIQAGDGITLPLIFDGERLRRSRGITNPALGAPTNGVNEIPAGGPMDYYMGRLWWSNGSSFFAGDIVGGPSGTAAYNFRDSIVNVTENPMVLGGDGFKTPSNEGDITALAHDATQDSSLGQGRLFAFTGKGVHSLIVPSTRLDWINADSTNQPLLVPIQIAQGTASDRSVVAVNGDLYYQSPQGEVRSILTAVRQFPDPGNRAISANENRLLKFTDASLLEFGTGMYFNNFLYQSALPINTPQGCIHQATMRLDFTPLSTFDVKGSAVWCGHDEGIDVLQYFTGIFDGEERAFAVAENRVTGDIDLWEITKQDRFDNSTDDDSDGTRIQMVIEYPAFTWQREFEQKELEGSFLWVDRVFGEVVFKLDYRTDGSTCWIPWHEWKICSAKNSCEDVNNPICYPILPNAECYRVPMAMPRPPAMCETCNNNLPSNRGYQFQPRLTVTGFCRVRGILLHGEFKHESIYNGIVCRLNA